MEPALSPRPDKKKRWLIVCASLVLTTIIVIGGTFGYLYFKYVDFDTAASMADSDLAAYRAKQMPWVADDLSLGPVPIGQNAAPLLKEASASVEKRGSFQDLKDAQKGLEEKKLDTAARLIAGYSADLALVEQAASRTRLDFNDDLDLGPVQDFSELSAIRLFVRTLCLRAQLAALKENPEAAARDLRSAWRLSILCGQEASLVPMLTQVACQNIVFDGVERCAAAEVNQPAALKQFADLIASPRDLADYAKSLRGEAYIGIASLRNPNEASRAAEGSGTPIAKFDKSAIVRTGMPQDVKYKAMMARHLEAWTLIKTAIDRFPGDTAKLITAVDEIATDWSKKQTVSYLIPAITLGPLSQAGNAVLELQARSIATRALLAAMQFRVKSRRWPTGIEEIQGKWIDPFSGQPLKLNLKEGGIRIYSVGPNGKDDGGIRQSEITDDGHANNYDIVASYPPRKLRF